MDHLLNLHDDSKKRISALNGGEEGVEMYFDHATGQAGGSF